MSSSSNSSGDDSRPNGVGSEFSRGANDVGTNDIFRDEAVDALLGINRDAVQNHMEYAVGNPGGAQANALRSSLDL